MTDSTGTATIRRRPYAATIARAIALAATGLAVSAGCATPAGGSAVSGGGEKPLLLVVGATGGTGKEVVKQAVAKGWRVRVLVRDEAKARTEFGDTVSYAVGNVREPATLGPAVTGATYVVSALGSTVWKDPDNKPEFVDYGGVKSLVEAAKAARVQHFVLVSSMGVTDPDNRLNKMFDNVLVWKLKGEDALRASGLSYTVVRPGGLRDGPGGQQGVRAFKGDPKVEGQIARADVATVCLESLGRKDAAGKTFEILNDAATTAVDWNAFFAGIAPDGR